MTTALGPMQFGRPATEAERQAIASELPWVQAAKRAAYRRLALGSRRRDRARLRRQARTLKGEG